MFANSQSQVTFNSGWASAAWCAARQRAFFCLYRHYLVVFIGWDRGQSTQVEEDVDFEPLLLR